MNAQNLMEAFGRLPEEDIAESLTPPAAHTDAQHGILHWVAGAAAIAATAAIVGGLAFAVKVFSDKQNILTSQPDPAASAVPAESSVPAEKDSREEEIPFRMRQGMGTYDVRMTALHSQVILSYEQYQALPVRQDLSLVDISSPEALRGYFDTGAMILIYEDIPTSAQVPAAVSAVSVVRGENRIVVDAVQLAPDGEPGIWCCFLMIDKSDLAKANPDPAASSLPDAEITVRMAPYAPGTAPEGEELQRTELPFTLRASAGDPFSAENRPESGAETRLILSAEELAAVPFQPVQPYAPEFFGENVLISFCARYPSAQAAPASLSEAVLVGDCILLKAAPVSADAQGDGWWWEGFVEISRADIAALLRDGKPRTALEFCEYGGESSAAVPDTFRGSEEGTENIPIAEESRNPD